MPDIYVMNGPISMSLLVWIVGVGITYGVAVLFSQGKKR